MKHFGDILLIFFCSILFMLVIRIAVMFRVRQQATQCKARVFAQSFDVLYVCFASRKVFDGVSQYAPRAPPFESIKYSATRISVFYVRSIECRPEPQIPPKTQRWTQHHALLWKTSLQLKGWKHRPEEKFKRSTVPIRKHSLQPSCVLRERLAIRPGIRGHCEFWLLRDEAP